MIALCISLAAAGVIGNAIQAKVLVDVLKGAASERARLMAAVAAGGNPQRAAGLLINAPAPREVDEARPKPRAVDL